MPHAANRFEIGLLYLAGVVQGLVLVTFPAAGTIFVSRTGFALTSTQYGVMFMPQVALAILASASGSRLAPKIGIRGVLLLGLCGDLVAMALLSASPLLMDSPTAFALLCVATGALGFGFGATVMSLNALVEGFFPATVNSAVLVLNALLGVGTALAPLLVALFIGLGVWWALPLLSAGLLILLVSGTLRGSFRLPYDAAEPARRLSRRLWIYAIASLLYGIVETLSGNWAILYLTTERAVPVQDASFALTAFWVMVTVGRVVFAYLDRVIPARWLYVALPVLLAGAFQLAAHATGALSGIVGFGTAGLACSAFLPLSISFGGKEFPRQTAMVSGTLIAVYQVGYGVAAFGVGPLRQFSNLAYSSIISGGSLVAIALGVVSLFVIRLPARVGHK